MKFSRRKFLFLVMASLGLLLSPWSARAAPYLTSDNVPANSWDKIGIALDGGTEVLVDPKVNTDSTQCLWYDLKDVAVGNHTIRLRAIKNTAWSVYATPDPYSFIRPALPAPINLRIVP